MGTGDSFGIGEAPVGVGEGSVVWVEGTVVELGEPVDRGAGVELFVQPVRTTNPKIARAVARRGMVMGSSFGRLFLRTYVADRERSVRNDGVGPILIRVS